MKSVFAFCVVLAVHLTSLGAAAAVARGAQEALPDGLAWTDDGANPAPQWQTAPSEGLGWLIPNSGRLFLRTAGRRAREADGEITSSDAAPRPRRGAPRPTAPKWILALAVCLVMLLAAPPARSTATSAAPAAEQTGPAEGELDLPPDKTVLTAERRRVRQPPNRPGGGFPRRPFLDAPNVVVNDPAEYPRPACLENNDPNSFGYSMRPNILNVPVEAEWDFYNIINTDRPDFTDAVYSVGKGVFLSENGYTFHKINDSVTHVSTRQLPESLIRYGVTDEFELRLKWNGYLMSDIRHQASGAHLSQFGGQDLDLGFKWELLQQRGWRPMTTVVAGLVAPTGTRGLSSNRAEPHVNLVMGWGIRRWLYVKTQSGVDFLHSATTQVVSPISSVVPGFVTTHGGQDSWHESISVLTQWTKRIGAFHEWFMISNTGSGDTRAQHFFDMGLYLYATPNIQFDVRIGKRASNRVDEMFTGAGLSGRW